MRRWLKEPLLHFAVLGIGLFALYRLISGDAAAGSDEIVVDATRIAALAEQFERSWRRPPTASEVDGLIDNHVRDEVLVREGLALGLDRDDSVIRSRIRLKMEILSDGPDVEVSEADLQAWFDANADRYATPARYDLRQVFFDPDRGSTAGGSDTAATLQELQRSPDLDPAKLGDSTLLPPVMSDVAATDVASQFGDELAVALADAPPGRWFGPVRSSYGEHLLRVDLRSPRKAAALADVKDEVQRDVRYARAQIANDALYARLRARYSVRIEKPVAGASDAALAADAR